MNRFSIDKIIVATGGADAIEYQIVENATGCVWATTYSKKCADDMLDLANRVW